MYEVGKDLVRRGFESRLHSGRHPGAHRQDRVRARPAPGHPAGLGHARQQRDRSDLPGRGAVPHHQGDRPVDRLPHRCHPDGRQAPDRSARVVCKRRPALLLRPQAARAEGHRRPLHPPRHPLPALPARRTPGGRTPGGHRERGLHRRSRPRARAGDGAHRRRHPANHRPARPPATRARRSESPTSRSTAAKRRASTTPSTSPATSSRARASSTSSRSTASAPRRARPAPRARSSPRTSCAP